jgi:hypothetical protein
MKPITKTELPKFLKVNNNIGKIKYNSWLTKPWIEGEIVKVLPIEEQVPSTNMSLKNYRKNFVRVLRKDSNGSWSIKSNWYWNIFDLLIKK